MFYTYIVASQRNGTLYTGMTDDLEARMMQHRDHTFAGFTAKYDCHMLVWYQIHPSRERAFARERAIKKWRRQWKIEMIEHVNPGWRDLLDDFIAERDKPFTPDQLPPWLRPERPA